MGGGIGDVFGGVGDAIGSIGDSLGSIGSSASDALSGFDNIVNDTLGGWGNAISYVADYFAPGSGQFIRGADAMSNGDYMGGLGSMFGGMGGDTFGLGSVFGESGSGALGNLTSNILPNNLMQSFTDMAGPAGELVGGLKMPSFDSGGTDLFGGLGNGISGSLNFMPGESSGMPGGKGGWGDLGSLFKGFNPSSALQGAKLGMGLINMFNQPKQQQPQYRQPVYQQQQPQYMGPAHQRTRMYG